MSFKNNKKWINKKIILLLIVFQKYYKELVFDIIDMTNHNIILGIP